MNKAQEEGLKHLEELQVKLEFLESYNATLKQNLLDARKEINDLYKQLQKQRECFYEKLQELPLISELAKRELNKTLENLCKLSKRERGTKSDILRRLGLDDTYNKK
jgi:hypothetical protein